MARDRLSSDYSEIMSDSTSCSCMTSSIEKSSVRSCGSMFQEPFFLHPPGSRPRDGLYINPMSSSFSPTPPRIIPVKDNNNGSLSHASNGSESFYLHSPNDLVYTRITHLFDENNPAPPPPPLPIERIASSRSERKDDTLTGSVVVTRFDAVLCLSNRHQLLEKLVWYSRWYSLRTELCAEILKFIASARIYEWLSVDDCGTVHRSRKADRRYSRSSSASESSNMSSEVQCYSSTTSTPSLSRNSSNERMSRSPKVPELMPERKTSTTSSTRAESEKETKTPVINGPRQVGQLDRVNRDPRNNDAKDEKITRKNNVDPWLVNSLFRPPPPPPPPPPEIEEVVIVTSKVVESTVKEEKKDGSHSTTQQQKCESTITTISGKRNFSHATSIMPRISLRMASNGLCTTTTTTTTACQVTAHLVNRHMVLPFIPPKFASQAADSDTLLKPSEYLRSICKASAPGSTSSLSKARSVDNLDCQGRGGSSEEESHKSEPEEPEQEKREPSSGPPPPPLPPPPINGIASSPQTPTSCSSTEGEPATKQTQQQLQQPLATISIQDLTSVQLRRTNVKMHATKTFSAPPNRSVSMTNVSEAFFVQKTDLIAELKKTKDIPGIKKLKVQRAQVEKSQEQNLISEISKAFSASNFVDQVSVIRNALIYSSLSLSLSSIYRTVDLTFPLEFPQIPEKDSSGNVIPIWKRQMLARKAAERAKKELEEQIARENEEKRQKAIPPWKRQLLAKKDSDVKPPSGSTPTQSAATPVVSPKIELPVLTKKEPVLEIPPPPPAVPVPAPIKSVEESSKPVVVQHEEKRRDSSDDTDNVHIIPWRAQLRKTNSKLNILD
ncbi:hypothetical protein TSAR_001795 [Trichomalopsis sarcophagae]|uniref:WH2 domain-containing protein n=1 Tax=Trichomalopsis sarcophagae TaxID=543379 RepID=A0A232EZQ5_9HYME|nr:hypothetical protein TSAR_001795 [Trichomalopsis sarcophagae]